MTNQIVEQTLSLEAIAYSAREAMSSMLSNTLSDYFLFFRNDTVLRDFKNKFANFLPTDVDLFSANIPLNSLRSSQYGTAFPYTLRAYARNNIGAISDDVIAVFRRKPFNNTLFLKQFIRTVEHDFTPIGYAQANKTTCLDLNADEFEIESDDVVFSYSCGYYDGGENAAIDGAIVNHENLIELHNGNLCHEDEAVYIDYRHEWYHENDCVVDVNDNRILRCDAVRVNGDYYHEESEDIFTCDRCDETYHIDEYFEDGVCVHCRQREHRVYNLKSYNTDVLRYWSLPTKADKKFNGKGVFCGFELEMEALEEEADSVSDFVKEYGGCKDSKFIFCQDGSLDEYLGLEAISAPLNMNEAKERAEWLVLMLRNGNRPLVQYDVDGGEKYGLHIHISSHFLTQFDKTKVQNFCTIHEKFIRKIGKRDQTEYQAVKYIRKVSDKKYGNESRYQAVNIQNSNTIEFRFPSSIVCAKHIGLNIELAYAITLFCTFSANVISQDQIVEFYKFVEKNRGEYPILHKFIQENTAK